MSDFVTNVKTNYTNVKVVQSKKEFTSIYEKKNSPIIISGENRVAGKKYTNRFVK